MSGPLVSIIIPCYNAERWVASTIESALRQTWSDKEIIVVNDGSKDQSLAAARQFEARGVRVIDQANAGASAARNTGLRAARGDYVQFLDADDLLAPDKLEQQMRLLKSRGCRIISSSRWARFQADPTEAIFGELANYRDMSGIEFLQLQWEQGCMMQPGAWLTPRAVLDAAGPWDESLSLNDDGEYFARVLLAADGIVFCPGARTFYRSGLAGCLSGRRDRGSLQSLFASIQLTTRHMAVTDESPRTRAAIAHAWKWAAFELYPEVPELSREAEARSALLGGSRRPFPAGGRFQLASRFLGWRLAKRLFC